MLRQSLLLFFALSLTAHLSGCGIGPDGPPTVTITGPVTLDNEAIPQGNIIFRKLDGDLKGFGGKIKNGAYSITVEPGKMAVEVVASREVPGKFTTENAIKEPVIEMYIPAKYNTKSELTLGVTLDGEKTVPFHLTSPSSTTRTKSN